MVVKMENHFCTRVAAKLVGIFSGWLILAVGTRPTEYSVLSRVPTVLGDHARCHWPQHTYQCLWAILVY